MANRTDSLAKETHGTNPQRIVEKILRLKIYSSQYWKEQCFGLTAETLVDRAIELRHIGGTYGGVRKPTKFICLLLKMLQIQPEMEIIAEFVKNDDYKYVRCLGALYLRCVGRPVDVYNYLEPLYADYSKIRIRSAEGWHLSHVDEFVDQLLTSDYACDISLPHLTKRHHLQAQNLLGPRTVPEDLFVIEDDNIQEEAAAAAKRQKLDTDPPGRQIDPGRGKLVMLEPASSADRKKRGGDEDVDDIEAANELRKRLGLKPLRL